MYCTVLCQYLIFLLDLSLMGQTSPDMEMSARELRQNVEMAFNRLDTNGDGVLTREEFVLSCLKVNPLVAILKLSYLYIVYIIFSEASWLME